MGADLYLPSIVEACYEHYGHAAHLADAACRLAQGDLAAALDLESQRLQEALKRHAAEIGTMPTDLFDLVAESADLAQGRTAVWAGALADQISTLIHQRDSKAGDHEDETGPSTLQVLAEDLGALLKARPEPAIMHGALWLAECLEAERSQTTDPEALPQVLAGLGTGLREALMGHGDRALAMLVERRMIPALARAGADQDDCVRTLTRALEPLLSDEATSTEGADFAPGQILARWRDLARQHQEVTDTLREQLRATLEEPVFQGFLVINVLMTASERLRDLWQEAEPLIPELEAAMDTLETLLLRTLLPADQEMGGKNDREGGAGQAPMLSPPTSSPLRQAFGAILRHRVICQGIAQLIERCAHAAKHLLGDAWLPALREICCEMAALLYDAHRQAEPNEEEPSLFSRMSDQFTAMVPLVPGLALFEGTLMDVCYLQMQTIGHRIHQKNHLQEWVRSAIHDESLTSTGLVVRFWLLLQGEPSPWAQRLVDLLREQCCLASGQPAEQERIRELLDQVQGLLEARPAPRLQALLHELAGRISSPSPLAGPVARLAQLVRGDVREAVRDAFQELAQEVSHLTALADSPEEQRRVADLNWLLELGTGLLQSEEEARGDYLCQMLVTLCVDCQQDAPRSPDAVFATRMAQVFLEEHDEQRQRAAFLALLESLEETGPLPPRADPRLTPLWRFRLFRDLIRAHLHRNERREGEAGQQARLGSEISFYALGGQVLQMMRRILDAWLFPPEGYFHDPYNDGSILWMAAGLFWPAIAEHLTEPRDEGNCSLTPCLAEEGEIPARIPPERVRDLLTLLHDRAVCLPSREHLARWGKHTIRVEEQGPYALSAWHAYFEQRRAALLAFLEEAIARQEPILCSL